MEGSEHPLISPHLPGLTPSSFRSSPPLPPPRYLSSKSFHRRQLQEEADARLPGRRSSRGGPRRAAGPGRAAGLRAPFPSRSPAPELARCSSLSPAAARVQVALWRHRGGGRCLSSAPPSLIPSLPRPRHIGVRLLHPSRLDFPLPLFWKGEVEGGNEAAKERPACKVLL